MNTKIIIKKFLCRLKKYKICYLLLVLTIITLNIPACTKEYSCESGDCYVIPSDTIIIPDSLYFFDITLNGERTLKIAGQDEYNVYNGGDLTSFFSGMSTYNFRSSLEFDKGTLNYDSTDSVLQRVAFFAPGDYNYSTDPGNLNGVELKWKDADGTSWRTSTGDQSGSRFTITSTDSLFDGSNNLYSLRVKATFNCWLYNKDGERMELNDGKFSLIIKI